MKKDFCETAFSGSTEQRETPKILSGGGKQIRFSVREQVGVIVRWATKWEYAEGIIHQAKSTFNLLLRRHPKPKFSEQVLNSILKAKEVFKQRPEPSKNSVSS